MDEAEPAVNTTFARATLAGWITGGWRDEGCIRLPRYYIRGTPAVWTAWVRIPVASITLLAAVPIVSGTPRQPIVDQARSCEGWFLQGMFPKSVSGTSGKRRENKGNDVEQTGRDETRESFLNLGFLCNETYSTNESIEWGQNRIRHLERHFKNLDLENERLSKTILTLSKSPLRTSLETDEEIHQRRRRERLLDEVTLFCVTFGFDSEDVTLKKWGHTSRGMATEIINGINEYDANH